MTSQSPPALAILPMRGGSERVPRKNLAMLGSKPLYAWILDTVLTLDAMEAVVDTDDDEIEEAVRESHPEVRVVRRPKHLGVGTTPMNAVLAHTLSEVSGPELILQVHATNPFVAPTSLSAALGLISMGSGNDSAFSATRLQARLWSETLEAVNHDPNVLHRTQDLPVIYIENSSFYAFRRETFMATGNRLGQNPAVVETSPLEAVDIDNPEDFEFAETIARGLIRERSAS